MMSNSWWKAKRRDYNKFLLWGGAGSCLIYLFIGSVFSDALKDFEITFFTVLFQSMAFVTGVVLANICYFLGPISEKVLNPKDLTNFRNITFRLGVSFSLLLIFSIPTLLLVRVILES